MRRDKKEGKYIFFLCAFLTFALSAEAALLSSKELLENAEQHDGETVVFKGEVIGDIMPRGESVWINVRDEEGAIGVFCPKEVAQEIKVAGNYKFSGDVVSVWGVFNRACPEHGGDSDIHAEKISVLEQGKAIEHPLDPEKVKWSIILVSASLVLLAVHLIVRKLR